ncbi:MAG: response regulator [Candidatus Symbiothrix sp.]|jgi:signal transduction histidine kinase/DNA-binding response OmpR family regulator/ligand-binding sensor domain-containing protein|nr:response regulator [Candidatus Symbiothrix sp.]
MKKIHIALLFLLSAVDSFPATGFRNINEIYGISMRETSSVCKYENGFIWTASKTGVLRIAGDDYRLYKLDFQNKDVLNVKLVYRDEFFLAYTNNCQVFIYNRIYDRFELLFNLSADLNTRRLAAYSAFIDNNGNFWLSTNMGLFLYSNGKYNNGKCTQINDFLPEITRITGFDDDNMLFICGDSICLMNINSHNITALYRHNGSFDFRVYSMYYDSDKQNLWIGTRSDGIFQYDFINRTFSKITVPSFPRLPVYAITRVTDSTVMVGIDGQGIWELDNSGCRALNIYKEDTDDIYSLRGDGVLDVFFDSEDKRLWVCTYSGGLSFCDMISSPVTQLTHQVNNSNSLINNNINQIIEDSDGNIWFATANGISRWNVATGIWNTFRQNNLTEAQAFLSLCEDDRKRIWAGTYSSGVYLIDELTGRLLKHYSKENQDSSGFDCNYVFDIIKDCNGDIWLGGVMDGVFHYDMQDNLFEPYPKIPLYVLAEQSENKILAACTYGLSVIDKQTGEVQILIDGYLVQDILFMDSIVWMCTMGSGLVKYNIEKHTTEAFTAANGLPSDYINSIMPVDGSLWLGTENGLCRFNPSDYTVVDFSTELPNVSYNRNACCRLRNGQLAWGTSGGAIIFDPAALQKSHTSSGRIFVQDILVSGRSIRENLNIPIDSLHEITLKYNQNNLTVEMLPLGTSTANIKFSWIMEGLNSEYGHHSDFRKLTYSNIPAGSYVLKIKMYDNSSSECISERRIRVLIRPPFWATWWFRTLFAAFIAIIVWLSLRFHINRLKHRHTIEKVHFFANMAHEIRTALTLIKLLVEELCRKDFPEEDKYYLNMASEQTKRLASTVTHLLDFQKADVGKAQLKLTDINLPELIKHRLMMFESFATSKNIKLDFAAQPTEYHSAIDESKIEIVIDNLVSNAIKYSNSSGNVEVRFTGDEKRWMLQVRDCGIGISRKSQKKLFREFYRSENAINSNIPGSGIGLVLAKNYISAHGGTIRCTSRKNEGSTFVVSLPLREIKTSAVENEPDEATLPKEILAKKMRLLIVEDSPDLLQFMHHSLKKEFIVITARDGAEAWEMIGKQAPDIVVSDVLMPNLDGFELCRLIKTTFETSHIPVVLITALTDRVDQLYGLGLGADNYLTKPFDIELVKQRIISIIHNRQIVRDKALKLIGENDNETLFTNELNDMFIKKAVETVRTNMKNTEFGKDDFASALNVSPSLLYKKLKSLTDHSPVDFIRSIRLNYALNLLQSGKYTVTEVADLCGFSDLAYFGKAFRKYFGKRPSEV